MSKLHLHALRLAPFGSHEDTRLEFAPPGTLTVVYGPNGAGKSTLRRAVHQLLFGIPRTRIQDDFRFQRAELRLEAELEIDGERRHLARIRGDRNSLRDLGAGEAVVAADWLPGLLGMERDSYEGRYCLDHLMLRRGGEALLNSPPGEVASLGLRTLHRLRRLEQALSTEAEALFKPKAQNPPLNSAIKHHRELAHEFKQAGLSAKQWQQAEAELRTLEAASEALKRSRQALKADLERLHRVKRARALLAQYREACADLAACAEVPDLAEDFEARRSALVEDRRHNGMLIEQHQERRDQLAAHRERLRLDPAICEQAEAIDDCIERRGGYRQALQELPIAELAAEAARNRYQEAANRAGYGMDQALPIMAEAAVERLRSLAGQHPPLLAAFDEAAEAQQEAMREHMAVAARELPTPDEAAIQALSLALEASAGLAGELEAAALAEQAAIRAGEAAAGAIGRLGEPYAGGAAFPAARVPAAAIIERYQRSFDEQAQAAKALASQAEELEAERLRNARQRDELCEQGLPPSREDLHNARERRELHWQAIKRQLTATTSGEPAGAGSDELPRTYEHLVAGADELADRRYQQTERAERLESIQAEARALDDRHRRIEEKRHALAERRDALEAEWRALWQAAGVAAAASPAQMILWRNDYDAALAAFEAHEQAARELQRCRQRVERSRAELCCGLAEAGAAAADEPAKLRQRAQARLRALNAQVEAYREQQQRLERSSDRLASAQRALEKIEARLARWRRDWQAALAELALDAGLAVEPAMAQLKVLAECTSALRTQRQAQERLATLLALRQGYEGEVDRLARQLLPTLPLEVDARVGALKAALKAGQAAEAERLRVGSEIDAVEARLRELAEARRGHQFREQGLLAEAGVAEFEQLVERVRRAAEKRDCLHRQAELRSQLFAIGDGRSPEQLAEEAEHEPAAGLQERLSELEAALEAQEQALADSYRALGEAQSQLDGLREGEAERLAQQKDAALDRVRELAERYASRELAAAFVRRAIEAYAERHQDPLLARASECFREVTQGDFAGVRTDYGDSDEVLHHAIRAGGERVPVASLSDGERDALFLSLYVAALEQQLKAGAALPVVFDDVLINVDDPRAEPILRLLGRLAEKTQVLLFTHHQRIAEAAQEAAAAVVCQLAPAIKSRGGAAA